MGIFVAQELFLLLAPIKIFSVPLLFGQSLGMLPFTEEKGEPFLG